MSLLFYTILSHQSNYSDDFTNSTVILAFCFVILGRFFLSGAFAVIYIYVTEIYPTNLTTNVFGVVAGFECTSSLVAVSMGFVYESYPFVPGTFYAVCGLIAGLIMMKMPEGANAGLLLGINDAVKFYESNF